MPSIRRPRLGLHFPHSPLEIQTILYCYYLAEPIPKAEAPAVQDALAAMLRLDLIQPCHYVRHSDGARWYAHSTRVLGAHPDFPNYYCCTERGEDWVRRLCGVAAI